MTKTEVAEYQRAYRQAHKTEVAEYQRAYYQAHKTEVVRPQYTVRADLILQRLPASR